MNIGLFPVCQDCFYDHGYRIGWCKACLAQEMEEARFVERVNCSRRIARLKDMERNSILKRTLQAAIFAVEDYNEVEKEVYEAH